MASNILEKQILEEGFRNAVVKLTGILVTNDINEVPAISLADFQNNEQRQVLKGFRVDHITFSLGVQIDVLLEWNSQIPQQITPLSRSGKIDVTDDGGFVPDMTRSGYDGSINLRTSGFPPGGPQQNFTILLRLIKLYLA